MSIARWVRWFAALPADELPGGIFGYLLTTSAAHQLLLVVLTVSVFLLEVVPLELQRRIADDLVKDRPYRWVIALCAVYAGVVVVQGGTKLVLNVYRGWVGERALRDLRHRIHRVIEALRNHLAGGLGDIQLVAASRHTPMRRAFLAQ
jgi:ABC-type multidrug transport system fused ATPase/permease subunit